MALCSQKACRAGTALEYEWTELQRYRCNPVHSYSRAGSHSFCRIRRHIMSYSQALSQWRETVSMAFPKLRRPQATVLALWSYGMILAKSCGITLVCATLALQLGCSEVSLLHAPDRLDC